MKSFPSHNFVPHHFTTHPKAPHHPLLPRPTYHPPPPHPPTHTHTHKERDREKPHLLVFKILLQSTESAKLFSLCLDPNKSSDPLGMISEHHIVQNLSTSTIFKMIIIFLKIWPKSKKISRIKPRMFKHQTFCDLQKPLITTF